MHKHDGKHMCTESTARGPQERPNGNETNEIGQVACLTGHKQMLCWNAFWSSFSRMSYRNQQITQRSNSCV